MTTSLRMPATHWVLCVVAALSAGCGGSDPVALAPPDGAACTMGTLSPGDSVEGVITSANCLTYDPYSTYTSYSQSWTLEAKAGMAYIVRVWHRKNTGADTADRWDGDVMAFGEGGGSGPTFLTGEWGIFGTPNARTGNNLEMAFQAWQDRTLSIRVSAYQTGDTGAYALTLEACPSLTIADTLVHAGIDFTTATCTSLSGDPTPQKVRFLRFASDSGVADTVVFHRTAGQAGVWSMVSGPGEDIDCWTDQCVASASPTFDSTRTHVVTPRAFGMMSLALAIAADSAATVNVKVHAKATASVPEVAQRR